MQIFTNQPRDSHSIIAEKLNGFNREKFNKYIENTLGRVLDQRVVQKLDPQHCTYLIDHCPQDICSLSPLQVVQMITAGKINSYNYLHITMAQLERVIENKLSKRSWSLLRGLYNDMNTFQFCIFWNQTNHLDFVKQFLLEFLSNDRLHEIFKAGSQHLVMQMCEAPVGEHFGINKRLANMIAGLMKDDWYLEWSYLENRNNAFWLQQQMIIHGDTSSINVVDFQKWHYTHLLGTFEKMTEINVAYLRGSPQQIAQVLQDQKKSEDKVVALARKMEPKYLLDIFLKVNSHQILTMLIKKIPVSTAEIPFENFWWWVYNNPDKLDYNDTFLHYAKGTGDSTKVEIVSMHIPEQKVVNTIKKLY